MTQATDIKEIRERLGGIAAALQADGYDLELTRDGDVLDVTIAAVRDDACADCLVPKSVVESMLTEQLKGDGGDGLQIRLNYPNDHDH